jgi:hypothetical protein
MYKMYKEEEEEEQQQGLYLRLATRKPEGGVEHS